MGFGIILFYTLKLEVLRSIITCLLRALTEFMLELREFSKCRKYEANLSR